MNETDILHLRRHCIRVKLLQLIDLPFIDCLVVSPKQNDNKSFFGVKSSLTKHRDLQLPEEVESNHPLANASLRLAKRFCFKKSDESAILTNSSLSTRQKFLIFYFVRDNLLRSFRNNFEAIFYPCFKEAIDEILLMFDDKTEEDSYKAIHYLVLMLDPRRLDQLRDVINFLVCLSRDSTFKLSAQRCNLKVATEDLLPIIFPSTDDLTHYKIRGTFFTPSRLLSRFHAFVSLLVSHHDDVFQLPPDLVSLIERKRALVESGEVETPSLVIDTMFAEKVSVEEYENQKLDFTQQQVEKLIQSIKHGSAGHHLSTRHKQQIADQIKTSQIPSHSYV